MTRSPTLPEAPARNLSRFFFQALWLTSSLAALSFVGPGAIAQPLIYEFWAAKAELEKRLSTSAVNTLRQAAEHLPSLMPASRTDEALREAGLTGLKAIR